MEKILILSYFYPPSNFVGAERTEAWVKYLPENGIYPIVITRQWNDGQLDLVDPVKDNSYQVDKTEQYEIHRLPYRRTLRDKCAEYRILRPLQKLLTLFEVIFSNFFLKALPYSNFYNKAREIISNDPEIKVVIASGRPFQSFFIGNRLKKDFPDLIWIPDYRDEWTGHKHVDQQNLLWKWINKLERKRELKWTSNADRFISVSPLWVERISKHIGKEGWVILNGYRNLNQPEVKKNSNELLITYAGSLYPSQDPFILIGSVIELLEQGKQIRVRFIGANFSAEQQKEFDRLTINQTQAFEFLPRIGKDELKRYLDQSDLLFLTGFKDIPGWYPVKLFEYAASGKPILLCPTDKDVMEAFIKETRTGFIAKNREECTHILKDCAEKIDSGSAIGYNPELSELERYSRKNQADILGKNILEIIGNELANNS